jgi:integrase
MSKSTSAIPNRKASACEQAAARSDDTTATKQKKPMHGRPRKPYPTFPLYCHPLGYWSAKVGGTLRHYGRWGRVVNGVVTADAVPYEQGWRDALTLYKAQLDDHKLGRDSRVKMVNGELTDGAADGFTVAELCNRFLTAKKRKLDTGRLSHRSFDEYKQTTDRLVAVLKGRTKVDDLRPDDFEGLLAEISKGIRRAWGLVRIGNEITRVKSVFKYGRENSWIVKPVPFGSEFKKPDRMEMRKSKAAKGGNMMEAVELRRLLDALEGKPIKAADKDGKPQDVTLPASPTLRAMVLLGINCAFGPTDCATLPREAVDLNAAMIDFPRKKTGIERRCPLWPETVAAITAAIAARPEPTQEGVEALVFLTARGRQFISAHSAHPVTAAMVDAMKATGVHREGRGPYTMRHAFRTIADEVPDRVAIDRIMGHGDHSMAGHYRERVGDARLVAVCEHVRQWLFGAPAGGEGAKPQAEDRPKLKIVG